MTSGLTRRRYNMLRIEATTITRMNSQPLVHIQVPAGRKKPRTKKSSVPPRYRDRQSAVDRFRLPWLIVVGCHVLYALLKAGSGNTCDWWLVWTSQSAYWSSAINV